MNEFMLIGDLIGKNIISDAIRSIAAFIDAIWLSVISLVYNLIFAVANFSSSEGLQNLYNLIESRVYVIVGIFMLFKVLMSLISYLANPDKLTDKEQGAGKLITRIITSVLMLIAVPQILFPMLDRLQEPLVRTVAKVVMGNEINTSDASFGDSMALSLFSAFFFPNEDCTGDGTYEWNTENPRENSVFTNMGDLPTLATEACSDGNKKIYRYDYFMFLSTIISTIVIIVLLLMGIDIAVRSFKLVVLKALAPIPILSYISPKSAKDGIFSSYVKLFATTWLDLFIKFGVIYLGFAFIQLILNGDLSVGLTSALLGSGFGMVFLILGAIIFMFQAPKFIKKALNLKDGEFGTGIAGLLGMGAATAGMIGSGVSGYKASIAADDANHRKHNVFRNVGAGLVGAIGGGATGAKVAMGKDASIGKVMEALNKKNAQTLAMGAAGSTGVGRFATNAQTFFTGQSEYDKDQKNIAALEAKEATAKQLKEYLIGEGKKKYADKTQNITFKNSAGTEVTAALSLDAFNAEYARATAAGGNGVLNIGGQKIAVGTSAFNSIKGDLEEGSGTLYANAVSKGIETDSGALASYQQAYADSLGVEVSSLGDKGTDVKKIKAVEKTSHTQAFAIKNSASYAKHKADANATGNSKK